MFPAKNLTCFSLSTQFPVISSHASMRPLMVLLVGKRISLKALSSGTFVLVSVKGHLFGNHGHGAL